MYLSRVRLCPEMGATQLSHLLKDRQGYGLHRLFWGLFSDGQGDQQQRDFLFRTEVAGEQLSNPGRRKADPIYYLLSKQLPRQDSPLFQVDSKPYHPQLAIGDRLAFKLRVNAVVTRKGKRHDIVMDAQSRWLDEQLATLDLNSNSTKSAKKRRLLDHADDTHLDAWKAQIGHGPFKQQLEQRLGRAEALEWAIQTSVQQTVDQWWRKQGARNGFELPGAGGDLEAVAYQKHLLPEKHRNAGFNSLDLSGEIIVVDIEKFKRLLVEGTGPAKAFGCGLMMIRRL